MFYNHFYYQDRTTRITNLSEIMNASDGIKFYKDTGEIYTKSGDKLNKLPMFQWLRGDLDALFISKEDDDSFSCTWTPVDDNTYAFGSASKRLKEIHAVEFKGVSTTAKYADLAEKYRTDKEYPYGTVLQIAVDSLHEVEKYNGGTLAGVISKKPAYKLNSEIDGQYVALTGQTPVKIFGDIKKGQYCVAVNGGVVCGVDKVDLTFDELKDSIGVALYDSKDGEVLVKM